MKRTIWLINHYASTMLLNEGGRHYWITENLKKRGYSPVVFCCNTKHNSNKETFFDNSRLWTTHTTSFGSPFVFVKSLPYSKNNLSRILNMLIFAINVIRTGLQYAKINGKPDVIIASSVHPLTVVAGEHLAKRFKVPCVCEIRDLWPESLIVYRKLNPQNLLVKFLYANEKRLYSNADSIVFTMEGGKDYLIEKRWDLEHGGPIDLSKVHHINNGVDVNMFDKLKTLYSFEDPDLSDDKMFIVNYTGSIRQVNEVERYVEVAKILRDMRKDKIKILLWGSGNQVDKIQALIKDASLQNIIYKGRVEKKYIPYVLSQGDLNSYFLTDSNLFRFGLSLNKSFEYFASGKPVLASSNSNYSIIDKFGCGICLHNNDNREFAETIIRFYNMSKDDYNKYCSNARVAAHEYDFSKLTDKYIEILENL